MFSEEVGILFQYETAFVGLYGKNYENLWFILAKEIEIHYYKRCVSTRLR